MSMFWKPGDIIWAKTPFASGIFWPARIAQLAPPSKYARLDSSFHHNRKKIELFGVEERFEVSTEDFLPFYDFHCPSLYTATVRNAKAHVPRDLSATFAKAVKEAQLEWCRLVLSTVGLAVCASCGDPRQPLISCTLGCRRGYCLHCVPLQASYLQWACGPCSAAASFAARQFLGRLQASKFRLLRIEKADLDLSGMTGREALTHVSKLVKERIEKIDKDAKAQRTIAEVNELLSELQRTWDSPWVTPKNEEDIYECFASDDDVYGSDAGHQRAEDSGELVAKGGRKRTKARPQQRPSAQKKAAPQRSSAPRSCAASPSPSTASSFYPEPAVTFESFAGASEEQEAAQAADSLPEVQPFQGTADQIAAVWFGHIDVRWSLAQLGSLMAEHNSLIGNVQSEIRSLRQLLRPLPKSKHRHV